MSDALQAAETQPKATKPQRSMEEVKAILFNFREVVQSATGDNGDILADFLAERRTERRAEAERG